MLPLPILVASADSQLISEPSILRIFCSVLCLPRQKLSRHSTYFLSLAPLGAAQSPLAHQSRPPTICFFLSCYHTSHRPRATSLNSPVSLHFKISCCLQPSTPVGPISKSSPSWRKWLQCHRLQEALPYFLSWCLSPNRNHPPLSPSLFCRSVSPCVLVFL